jgi:hypothetical protein
LTTTRNRVSRDIQQDIGLLDINVAEFSRLVVVDVNKAIATEAFVINVLASDE